MKKTPKKVFIHENGEYVEITYEELCRRLETNQTYADRKFLSLHGMLMEVTDEDYQLFYQDLEQQRYLCRRSAIKGDVSIDGPLPEELSPFLIDPASDVAEMVEDKMMVETLKTAIGALRREDQRLIFQYFHAGMTEESLAELYGVTQQTISYRLARICRSLKKILG